MPPHLLPVPPFAPPPFTTHPLLPLSTTCSPLSFLLSRHNTFCAAPLSPPRDRRGRTYSTFSHLPFFPYFFPYVRYRFLDLSSPSPQPLRIEKERDQYVLSFAFLKGWASKSSITPFLCLERRRNMKIPPFFPPFPPPGIASQILFSYPLSPPPPPLLGKTLREPSFLSPSPLSLSPLISSGSAAPMFFSPLPPPPIAAEGAAEILSFPFLFSFLLPLSRRGADPPSSPLPPSVRCIVEDS